MAHFFRAPDRRQRFLLPVDMMEWLPEDDIVHLIVDAVGLMDLITPPSTIFAAFHQYAGPKDIAVFEFSGHEVSTSHFLAQLDLIAGLPRPAAG